MPLFMAAFMSRPENVTEREAALSSPIARLTRAAPDAEYVDLLVTLAPVPPGETPLRSPTIRVFLK